MRLEEWVRTLVSNCKQGRVLRAGVQEAGKKV